MASFTVYVLYLLLHHCISACWQWSVSERKRSSRTLKQGAELWTLWKPQLYSELHSEFQECPFLLSFCHANLLESFYAPLLHWQTSWEDSVGGSPSSFLWNTFTSMSLGPLIFQSGWMLWGVFQKALQFKGLVWSISVCGISIGFWFTTLTTHQPDIHHLLSTLLPPTATQPT